MPRSAKKNKTMTTHAMAIAPNVFDKSTTLKMSRNGSPVEECGILETSLEQKRMVSNVAKPKMPFRKMLINIACGTAVSAFLTSSASYTTQISNL